MTLAVISYSNFTTYYGVFVPACKYELRETRQAGVLGNYLQRLPRETTVLVLPQEHGFRAGLYRSLDFLSGRMPIANVDNSLESGRPPALSGAFPDGLLVAAVPERARELARVAE